MGAGSSGEQLCPGFGSLSFLTVVNQRVEYLLLKKGYLSEQRFVLFSLTWLGSLTLLVLGLSALILLLVAPVCGMWQGMSLTFRLKGLDSPSAGFQAPVTAQPLPALTGEHTG